MKHSSRVQTLIGHTLSAHVVELDCISVMTWDSHVAGTVDHYIPMECEGPSKMAHARDTSQGGTTSDSGPVVRAQLSIEPDSKSGCAVVSAGDTHDVNHHLKSNSIDGTCDRRECHTEFEPLGDERNRAYITSEVGTNCICPVFENYDCIPEIQAVRSGTIVVTLTVPQREILREILAELKAVDATVTVDWLVHNDQSDSITEIDVSAITDKQQEAMETARELGYYETPRETDLGELADELGVSKSAVSQRLNAAETKLVTAFLDD